MSRRIFNHGLTLALTLSLAASLHAGERPRLGVSVIDTSNSAGVIVTRLDDKSPATKMKRFSDGKSIQLESQKHAITHVNNAQVPDANAFIQAIAASPREAVLRVYTYATADWDDYKVKLNGKATAPAVVYQPRYQQPAQYQQPQVYYEQQEVYQPRELAKNKRKKGGLFNWGGKYPEGDDWRPGDHTWWFQKKPTDPEIRKAYKRQVFVETLTGIAAGLGGAAEGLDSYQPYSAPASRSNSGWFGGSRDSFNRNYSTNPDHAPFIYR